MEATVSRQPVPPQPQGAPPGSTVMWPSPPDSPYAPRCSEPPTTSPPPTPWDSRR